MMTCRNFSVSGFVAKWALSTIATEERERRKRQRLFADVLEADALAFVCSTNALLSVIIREIFTQSFVQELLSELRLQNAIVARNVAVNIALTLINKPETWKCETSGRECFPVWKNSLLVG